MPARRLRVAPAREVGKAKAPAAGKLPSLKTTLGKMADSHLLCRDFGHMWKPFQARRIPQRQQWEERLRCERCATVRVRLLSNTGAQLGSAYLYPDGYTMHGYGRLSGTDRDAVRLASLQTVMQLDGVETIDPRKRKGA